MLPAEKNGSNAWKVHPGILSEKLAKENAAWPKPFPSRDRSTSPSEELPQGDRQGEAKPLPKDRMPRIGRLMRLAIHFQKLAGDGTVSSYAELAQLGHVTRTRISQIMALLNFAPDIQEEPLFLSRTESGRDPITERTLRPIAKEADSKEQRGI